MVDPSPQGNFHKRVEKPLSHVSGQIIGDALLPAVKAAMAKDGVLSKLFGCEGERIFIKEMPNYNDTIIPLIEMHWKGERWQSQRTRISGTIAGMIVLPADLTASTDRYRQIAAAFARWIESRHTLFKDVSGLIEFGTNLEFKYDSGIKCGGLTFPVIDIVIPVVFDLTIFRAENPEIDLDGPLDADLFGWVESYNIKVKDEKDNVLIDTQLLSKTGQTQDG